MNLYGRQLSAAEIAAGEHRNFVGGLWEELGKLQFEFLVSGGLRPHHRFIDVGCGALRGGVHFVGYLDCGNYYGLDINASLLEAGRNELAAAGLAGRDAHLLADDSFCLDRFGERFDYGLALSVFTHLPMNTIVRCLRNVSSVLANEGVFYATYFDAPAAGHLAPLFHQPGGVTTHFDRDPFHYSLSEFVWMAGVAGLDVEAIGEWGHPRAQRMLAFRRRTDAGARA